MIAYNPSTALARAAMLHSYNDLDVFVEDVSCHNMYVRLFTRLLNGRGRVSSVIALGSRSNVIKACAADQGGHGRPRIYVIDGDQDLITETPKPRLMHLYRLGVYCAENLVTTEVAACSVAMEGMSSASWQTVQHELRVGDLIETTVGKVLPLFVLYGIIHRLDIPMAHATVGLNVLALLADNGDPWSLSSHRVRQRIRVLLQEVFSHVSRAKYARAKRAVRSALRRNLGDPRQYISGKTYLLPLVQLHLAKAANVRDSCNGLKVRLATHCELDVDYRLRNAVRRALKSA